MKPNPSWTCILWIMTLLTPEWTTGVPVVTDRKRKSVHLSLHDLHQPALVRTTPSSQNMVDLLMGNDDQDNTNYNDDDGVIPMDFMNLDDEEVYKNARLEDLLLDDGLPTATSAANPETMHSGLKSSTAMDDFDPTELLLSASRWTPSKRPRTASALSPGYQEHSSSSYSSAENLPTINLPLGSSPAQASPALKQVNSLPMPHYGLPTVPRAKPIPTPDMSRELSFEHLASHSSEPILFPPPVLHPPVLPDGSYGWTHDPSYGGLGDSQIEREGAMEFGNAWAPSLSVERQGSREWSSSHRLESASAAAGSPTLPGGDHRSSLRLELSSLFARLRDILVLPKSVDCRGITFAVLQSIMKRRRRLVPHGDALAKLETYIQTTQSSEQAKDLALEFSVLCFDGLKQVYGTDSIPQVLRLAVLELEGSL